MPPEKKKPQDSPIFNYFKEDKEKGENGSWICQAVVGKGVAEDGEDILQWAPKVYPTLKVYPFLT